MIYSKLLNEYIIVTDVNDKFKIDRVSPSSTDTVTLTTGRYRDIIALADEIQTQLDALSWGTWVVAVSNTTGIITIDCDEDWDFDWNTSEYGTTLRNDLGFTGSESTDGNYTITATSQHVGGFYPSEPIESDNRPDEDGIDRWATDCYQQEGRSGLLATKGGDILIYRRSITFLLAQTDLTAFQTWLSRCAQGYSFAFYHNRTEAWDGPSSEYAEYKLDLSEGLEYLPERIEAANTIWHRQTLLMRKRVAPTA